MPIIKYNKILKRVLGKPVFMPEDLHHEGVPKNYSKKLLFMLAKAGRAKRIERGKYTCSDDPVTVAAHITKPCYLSLWTAMSIRKLTTQIPFAVDVVTSRKRFKKKIDFADTKIIFHTVSPRMMFGYENIIWKDARIPVANPEKIVIDAISVSNIPEEEILLVIKHSDISLLKKYAELSGDERIIKKVKRLIKCLRKKK